VLGDESDQVLGVESVLELDFQWVWTGVDGRDGMSGLMLAWVAVYVLGNMAVLGVSGVAVAFDDMVWAF